MIVSRYAWTALASPLIAAASLCDMQLDVGYVLPPVTVVPTHWPGRMRSAAWAGRAAAMHTRTERTVTQRLVFMVRRSWPQAAIAVCTDLHTPGVGDIVSVQFRRARARPLTRPSPASCKSSAGTSHVAC